MAKDVGEKGVVYAVDIQQEMLDLLAQKMAERKISNVKGVLGTITDPKLPAHSVDLVLMVDVYHEFDHPLEMMQAICQALKPGGRVVFVRAEDQCRSKKSKMSEARVAKRWSPAARWVEQSTLPWRIIVFKKGSGLCC
jgi:ubiquinone/menaquinone biosynthesis C-methylase UbiE